jgi:hypothetical protein
MKRKAAHYVSECDTYLKGKADYMKPGGLLQPLSILEWKWDDTSMDFIVGLPMTTCKFDSIWVIIDRLSKSAHFIPVNTNYKVQKYAQNLHSSRVMLAWSSEDNNLRPRFVVCCSLLRATTHVPWDSLNSQFSLSPAESLELSIKKLNEEE